LLHRTCKGLIREELVSNLENMTAFLKDLTAVSLSHYQLWDEKGKMLFTTDRKEDDFRTTTSRLEMAKNVILSNAFSYTPVKENQYLCGLPIDLTPSARGAILAMGPRPGTDGDNGHPGQLEALLGRISGLGRNGSSDQSGASQDATEPEGQTFEDLYLFANISRQFRSLRFKQPILGKLLHRMANSLGADAAFLRLEATPQFDVMEFSSGVENGNGDAARLKAELKNLVTAGIHQCSGRYCMVNDSSEEESFKALSDRPFRFLATAVRHMRKMYGWVGLASSIWTSCKPWPTSSLQ